MRADPLSRFERWRRWMLLATIALVVAFLLWFRARFELVTVPKGMDTLPRTHPVGALCLVVKHPENIAVGDVVFADLPKGGTLLLRVTEVQPDGRVLAASDNKSSTLTGGKPVGPLAHQAVRGRVATVIGGEPETK